VSLPGGILALGLIISLVAAVWRLPALHPVQLWLLVWSVSTALYTLRLLPYIAISWTTFGLAGGASLAFVVTATASSRWRRHEPERALSEDLRRTLSRAAIWVLAVAAVWLAAYLTQVVVTYGLSSISRTSVAARQGIEKGDFSITIKYVYLMFAAITLTAYNGAVSAAGMPRRRWIGICVLCVASLYFATGRATVVDGAIAGSVTYALASPHRLRKRTLILAAVGLGVLALAVFLSLGAIIGKTFAHDPSFLQVPNTFARHRYLSDLALPYQYASAPIAALQVQVHSSSLWGDGHGCAILPSVCSVLGKIGIAVPHIPRIRAFTAPPFPWNTYTSLDAPLIDGGKLLVIPIVALIGSLLGLLWSSAARRNPLAVIFYALEAVALVTAAGSFNFTAPQLIGAFLIAAIALGLAYLSPPGVPFRRSKREPTTGQAAVAG
jgi:oligosaccharide repeat unit polymerase